MSANAKHNFPATALRPVTSRFWKEANWLHSFSLLTCVIYPNKQLHAMWPCLIKLDSSPIHFVSDLCHFLSTSRIQLIIRYEDWVDAERRSPSFFFPCTLWTVGTKEKGTVTECVPSFFLLKKPTSQHPWQKMETEQRKEGSKQARNTVWHPGITGIYLLHNSKRKTKYNSFKLSEFPINWAD